MKIKIKRCEATTVSYEETAEGIRRVENRVVISGKRITEATVLKQIPREHKLLKWGYIDEVYEIDDTRLHDFLRHNGKLCDE